MSNFTIRVYGVIIENGKLLLSRERILNQFYVKLPGGGLEYGEGTKDCLRRELLEETGLHSDIGNHFYTTDFFQPSSFHREPTQVLSVYYQATILEVEMLKIRKQTDESGFFWVDLKNLTTDAVDLPIDKLVVQQIINTQK